MMGSATVWRRSLKFWLPGLILLIVNMVVLSTYRVLFAGQTQLQSSRVERLTADLEELQQYRQALDDVLTRAENNRLRVEEFHGRWLSSEADRLTQVITEVKQMARGAGVKTSGFRYPDEVLEEFELVRRSIVFSVEGSYQELRRFIHAIERSDQFLILEDVGVRDSGGESTEILVRLRLSTMFINESESGKA